MTRIIVWRTLFSKDLSPDLSASVLTSPFLFTPNSEVCWHAQSKHKHNQRHTKKRTLWWTCAFSDGRSNTTADGSRGSALTDRLSAVILIANLQIWVVVMNHTCRTESDPSATLSFRRDIFSSSFERAILKNNWLNCCFLFCRIKHDLIWD